MPKNFRLKAEDIRPLVTGVGGCMASDAITVEGKPVGFLYREEPNSDIDSGWNFFAGDESEDYLADSANFEIYDVNTIANYDARIIPLLSSPAMSAFAWDPDTGRFQPVPFPLSGLN